MHTACSPSERTPAAPVNARLAALCTQPAALVNTCVWPQVLPLLSITKKRGKGADILYPAGHYAIAGKSVTAIGTDSGSYRQPWERKNSSVAFWRGRPNSHTLSRWALPRLALEGSAEERQLLDVGLLWYMHAHDPFVRANRSSAPIALRDVPRYDMFEHSHYKYLVHLDGHSCAPPSQLPSSPAPQLPSSPAPQAQRPTPNAQRPTPNAQRPTPNAQRAARASRASVATRAADSHQPIKPHLTLALALAL